MMRLTILTHLTHIKVTASGFSRCILDLGSNKARQSANVVPLLID